MKQIIILNCQDLLQSYEIASTGERVHCTLMSQNVLIPLA